MPTVRTITVKSSGGDYSSLSAAEAAEQGNLVTLDRQLNIECYSFEDTTKLTIDGWTTDSTRYIHIYAATGEGHEGVWSTSKYRLSANVSYDGAINLYEDYVRFTGLQVENLNTSTSSSRRCIVVGAGTSATDIRFDRLIVRGGDNDTLTAVQLAVGSSVTVGVYNSIFLGGIHASTSSVSVSVELNYYIGPTLNFYNNTVAGCRTGLQRIAGTFNVTNCYVTANTTMYSGAMTLTTCAHSSTDSFSGSTASIAYSTANFTNVTSGSEDLHLIASASSTLLTGGTDLSATFTTDIDGETRSDWGIGADEYVSAGGANPKNVMRGIMFSGPMRRVVA